MSTKTDRRTFIKGSLLAPAVAAMALNANGNAAAAEDKSDKPDAAATLACGKIGDLSVSRMLLGGNLLTHYTHSRDLQYVYNLCAHYNTEAKIIETLALAEQHGINALVVHTAPGIIDTLKKHRYDHGGKIQWIVCPTEPIEGELAAYAKQVRQLADDGAEAIYVWGVKSDQLVAEGKTDLIRKAVDIAKEHNLPSGVGAHDLKVLRECEEKKVGADFYIKTFHHHKYPSAPKPEEVKGPYNEDPGYWCSNPDELIAFMKDVNKPWIAFKIMAAGAIPPKDAFQYVFDNGADHILVGMFDFEIAEDVKIAKDALANVKRDRPWRS